MRFFLLQVLTLVILGITLVAAARAQPKPYLEPVQAGTEVELHDRTYLSYPFGAGATPSELALKERAKYEVFLTFPPYVPPQTFYEYLEPGTLDYYLYWARVRFHKICLNHHALHRALARMSHALLSIRSIWDTLVRFMMTTP